MRLRDGWWPLRRDWTEPASARTDAAAAGRGSSELAAVLDAVVRLPALAERAGEDAAVDAYRAARMDARRRPTVRSTALPWARAGAWVAAVAVAGTAGAALAAGVQYPDRGLRSTQGTGPAPAASQVPAAAADRTSTTRTPSPTGTRRPAPAPALKGLCAAYLANGGQSGKALSSTASRKLVEAAGGPDRVAAYCHDLIQGVRPKPSRPNPGEGGRPGSAPSHHPSVPAGS
jgi:hypothetical protein